MVELCYRKQRDFGESYVELLYLFVTCDLDREDSR